MQCGRSCGVDGVGLHAVHFHELGIKRRSARPGCRPTCVGATEVSVALRRSLLSSRSATTPLPRLASSRRLFVVAPLPVGRRPDRARDPLSAAFPPGTCAMPCAARRCASCHAAIRYFFPFAGVLSASSAKTATSIPWLPGARCVSRNEVRCLCEPRASFGLSELRCLSSKAPNDRGKIEAARQNCVE